MRTPPLATGNNLLVVAVLIEGGAEPMAVLVHPSLVPGLVAKAVYAYGTLKKKCGTRLLLLPLIVSRGAR